MPRAIIVFSRLYDFMREAYEIGGIETYIRNLCPVLSDAGFEPHVVFASGCAVEAKRDGMVMHAVQGDSRISARKLVHAAETIGDPYRDLLIFGTSSLVCKTLFAATIGIQHGIYWDTEKFHGRNINNSLVAFLLSAAQTSRQLWFHRLVSDMVCVDLNYVNWMRAFTAGSRLPYTYIPNFAEATEISQRVPHEPVRVVFARRFEEIRGCELLAEALPSLMERHPEVELTIAGGGSMESMLRKRFEGNPRVTFTQYDVSNSIAFHSAFDIAIVPSVASEGTSLSLLEAMSAGCAVVATDVGGMSNIVLDGHNGLLVRPDVGDLHNALDRLIADETLREALASKGQKTVLDAFSRDLWAKRWVAAVNSIAGGER